MPVGQGYQSITGHLTADTVFLGDRVVLNEREDFLAVHLRQEELLVEPVVVSLKVTGLLASLLSATESIFQPFIDDKARSHDEEVAGEASGWLLFVQGVEHLPDNQCVHHPCLASAGSHLHSILGYFVFLLCQLCQVELWHQVGRYLLIVVEDGLRLQHLMQIDDVEDSLSLTFVEVHLALVAACVAQPVVQQVGSDGCHLLKHRAVFPCLFSHVAESLRQFQ